MATLIDVETRLRGLQGLDDTKHFPLYLFRGQCRDFGNITPLIARRPSKDAIEQLYQMFREADLFAKGIGGYMVGRRDGVALLQHYGLPTPFIDFTGCLDVAIFFSLLGAAPGDEAVIYVLNRSKLLDTALAFELDFLCLPFSEGGRRHRHWRQDAFVVGPEDWKSPPAGVTFDLLKFPYKDAIEIHTFTVRDGDRADIADILSLKDDPIPHHLLALIQLWAQQKLSSELHQDIKACLSEMIAYVGSN
jgi:hypothetical protein